MTQEQLRMQMLAGIITEGQYKEKMEEEDSYGKVGKQYPAPGYEDMKKGKVKDNKETLRQQIQGLSRAKDIQTLYNDASQGLIFVSQSPKKVEGYTDLSEKKRAVYVDENSKYKNLLTGEGNDGLDPFWDTIQRVLPKSESPSSPYKLDFDNFWRILKAVYSDYPRTKWLIQRIISDYSGLGADMLQLPYAGKLVDVSSSRTKEKLESIENSDDYGKIIKISDNLWWINFRSRE
jgi:hypothetical protein